MVKMGAARRAQARALLFSREAASSKSKAGVSIQSHLAVRPALRDGARVVWQREVGTACTGLL